MSSWINSTVLGGITIGGITVEFLPEADYKIWPSGSTPDGQGAIRLESVRGVTFNYHGARISTNNDWSTHDGLVVKIANSSDLTFNGPNYICTSCSGSIDPAKHGVQFYVGDLTGTGSTNIIINNARQNWGSAFLLVTGDPTGATDNSAHGITVINADLSNTFYGFGFEGSGDDVFITGATCTNCGRIYYPWNVNNHSFSGTQIGGGAGYVNVLLGVYARPAAIPSRQGLTGINVKFRQMSMPGSAVGVGLSMVQGAAKPVVTGAVDNGLSSHLLRVTVDSTANMATGQIWYVPVFGGMTGSVFDNLSPVTVIDANNVDLQGSAGRFAGTYTSGGYMSVPALMRDVHVQMDRHLAADQPQALLTYKSLQNTTPDLTPNAYLVEDVSFSGSLKGQDFGTPTIAMFVNGSGAQGSWTGEKLRNISLRDLTVTGASSSVVLNASSATNFELRNVFSSLGGIPWTVTGSVRAQNVSATGVTDRVAVVPSTAPANNFANGLLIDGDVQYARPTYSNLTGSIPTGTTYDGTLRGTAVGAPPAPAPGFGLFWHDGSSGTLHAKDSTGIESSTVVGVAGPTSTQFMTYVGIGGGQHTAQPVCADLSNAGAFCAGTDAANLTGTVANARLSGIPNASLANSSMTINGIAISLGASGTVAAAAGTLTGITLASNVISSSLTSFGPSPTLTTPTINGLTTGTGVATANTASTLVARDGSGNFSAGTITASLIGHASLDCALTGPCAIGTSVTTPLHIGGSGTTGTQLTFQTTTGAGTTDQFAFNGGNNGATLFGLLSTGGFVIGSSNASLGTSLVGVATPYTGASTSAILAGLRYNGGGATGAQVSLASSRGAAPGTFSAVQAGDGLGGFLFTGDNGSSYTSRGATIRAMAVTNWSSGLNDAKVVIAVTATGTGTTTDALTVNSSGGLSMGTAADPGINNASAANYWTSGALIAKGTAPVGNTGSCAASSFAGGATAGRFSAAACVAGTIILSSLPAAPNGYTCTAQDQTTPADTLKQTANTTTSVTFTATTAASDVIAFQCMAW